MALLDLAKFKKVTGTTGTDATRDASLNEIIAGVCAAFIKAAGDNVLEGPTTYTEIYDAPWNSNVLYMRQGPVNSITGLYVNFQAKGDTSLFTSDHLKTQYTDYVLDVDRSDGRAWGRAVRCLTRSNWGSFWQERPAWGALTYRRVDVPRAIKVVYSAGLAVPDDVVMALSWAVQILYNQRKTGAALTSESWNGYSRGLTGPFTTTSALYVPNVFGVLSRYYLKALTAFA